VALISSLICGASFVVIFILFKSTIAIISLFISYVHTRPAIIGVFVSVYAYKPLGRVSPASGTLSYTSFNQSFDIATGFSWRHGNSYLQWHLL